MKPETLKKRIKQLNWFSIDTVDKLPAGPGYLLLELIKRYKIPAKELGYYHDTVAVKTNKQIICWKDTGIGARFLGLLNKQDNSVEQHPDDAPTKTMLMIRKAGAYDTKQQLWKEIENREYDNIIGLRAKVSEEEYYDALEALPPMKMGNNYFIMSEAITDNLYMKYVREKEGIFCEVVKLEDEEVMIQ